MTILFFNKGDLVPDVMVRAERADCPLNEIEITFSCDVLASAAANGWHLYALGNGREGPNTIEVRHVDKARYNLNIGGNVVFHGGPLLKKEGDNGR